MTDAINKCSANETAACCCVDVGTVVDNTDCTASWSGLFADRHAAEAMLKHLSERARQVESEPCDIRPQLENEAEGVRLNIDFIFACQAESLIFQLGLR
ncbi:MAG: YfcZ/YiiS family protein [Pantoea sp.]|uniref:YfcZ/YiiS family protein n=1 Tax=Pantoea phytobeneficialis TaxID=2052056 RepID=A0AAP9KQ28_9GAMM|nr:YfcZ/YiiS family protein [Pantoea phytobeneficialis]MDO6405056.1 YfcZ/YiiS family protein [Pantoea phytobeneficialis]QGR07586.1 hypothetical protein CTZ24_14655 [Pantoea phytobeneficialis]